VIEFKFEINDNPNLKDIIPKVKMIVKNTQSKNIHLCKLYGGKNNPVYGIRPTSLL
jgi:uncharacterized protein YodC (DUF2158 family)